MTSSKQQKASTKKWQLWAVAAFLIMPVTLFFIFGGHQYLSIDRLGAYQQILENVLSEWPFASAFIYLCFYAAATAFSLPVGVFITLIGGFLFGAIWGTFLTVVGASLGAVIIFVIARIAGDVIAQKCPPGMLEKIRDGIQGNAFYFILTIRLIPVFPFWVVNIAPALLGVGLLPYTIATFIGIIPGTFVFALAGTGIGDLLALSDGGIKIEHILTGKVTFALIGLGLLSLLPPCLKWLKARRNEKPSS